MTATRTQNTAIDHQLILELKIDASGEVTRNQSKLGRKDTLEGKLLAQVYPDIQVARVSVPFELAPYEQSVVENRMMKLVYGGVEYKLVGASGSAKDGKFYFVDQAHAAQIAERFQHWPEAAIVYFAILVSDCKLMVEVPALRIAVVEDHVLGTNDCRGWARESIYKKLKIGTNRFCQFRLAFDVREPKQAKGALKAMSDRVAERLGVDLILPESACKPALKGSVRFLPQLGTSGRMFTGPAYLGIKEVSRVSEFGSSYTLIEHASEDALQFEIMLWALKRISKLKKAWDEGDYQVLFEIIGKSEMAANDDDVSFDPDSLEREQDPASEGWDPAEAVLLADHSGNAIKFPYVFNQLNRKLARWVFRTCTGGDLKLPAFALADDGVLIEHRGKIISASDWIPEDTSITSLTAEKGLCVRYPIRMQEDLLPVRHLINDEFVPMLKRALGVPDLEESVVAHILERQRKSAVLARNKAQAALWEHEKDAKDQFSSLHLFVHYWAQGKEEDRRAWAQAMNTVVTGGTGSGAVLFQSFPQEVVDTFAEVTGGQKVRVRLPKTINGHVRFDHEQRAWLVERIVNPEGPEGEKKVFLFQYKGKRNLVFENTGAPAVMENS